MVVIFNKFSLICEQNTTFPRISKQMSCHATSKIQIQICRCHLRRWHHSKSFFHHSADIWFSSPLKFNRAWTWLLWRIKKFEPISFEAFFKAHNCYWLKSRLNSFIKSHSHAVTPTTQAFPSEDCLIFQPALIRLFVMQTNKRWTTN